MTVLPFGRLWYGEPNAASNAVDYAKFSSHSDDAVFRVYAEAVAEPKCVQSLPALA
jgi:hypothetical protein